MTYFKMKRCFDVATEIFRLRHRNKLNREKQGCDITSTSRQRFQHKCKEVKSRHKKLGCDSTSQLNKEKSSRYRKYGPRHENRLKVEKLCHDKNN